jgi:hypothetical protein
MWHILEGHLCGTGRARVQEQSLVALQNRLCTLTKILLPPQLFSDVVLGMLLSTGLSCHLSYMMLICVIICDGVLYQMPCWRPRLLDLLVSLYQMISWCHAWLLWADFRRNVHCGIHVVMGLVSCFFLDVEVHGDKWCVLAIYSTHKLVRQGDSWPQCVVSFFTDRADICISPVCW